MSYLLLTPSLPPSLFLIKNHAYTIKSECPGVSNVMMVGDQRKFNVALITLKTVGATGELPGTEELDGAAATMNPAVRSVSAAMTDPQICKIIESAIGAVNRNGKVCPSNASKIQRFTILPTDFSVVTEELTPTLKLKRGVVEKKYAEQVEIMYGDQVARGESYVRFAQRMDLSQIEVKTE